MIIKAAVAEKTDTQKTQLQRDKLEGMRIMMIQKLQLLHQNQHAASQTPNSHQIVAIF